MQRSYMASLATYITLVETKLFSDSGIVGWETWFKRNQNTILNWLFRILLWPGLLAFTTYVALHPSVFLANSAR